MGENSYLKIFKERGLTVVAIVLFFLILATIFTFIQPLKYGADSKLIIIQTLSTNDPYSISKANETVGNILANAVTSNTFLSQVLNSEFNIDKNYFGTDINNQTKIWQDTVAAKAVNDTGILEITVWHKDKTQADLVSQAVSYVLKTNYNLFLSEKAQMNIRVLDKAVVTTWPVKPNIALNFLVAFVVGLVFGFIYIYLTVDDGVSDMPSVQSFRPAVKAGLQEMKYHAPAMPADANAMLFRSPVYPQNANYNQPVQPVRFGQVEEQPAMYGQTARQQMPNPADNAPVFKDKAVQTPTDDLDLDIIIKSGSMANVFGSSNLKN